MNVHRAAVRAQTVDRTPCCVHNRVREGSPAITLHKRYQKRLSDLGVLVSGGQQWTIDSIAHALPHPELRATFMREASFTGVRQLPDILQRWVDFIERFEAERPRVEALRARIAENGELPADYAATLVSVTPDELRDQADHHRGAA